MLQPVLSYLCSRLGPAGIIHETDTSSSRVEAHGPPTSSDVGFNQEVKIQLREAQVTEG